MVSNTSMGRWHIHDVFRHIVVISHFAQYEIGVVLRDCALSRVFWDSVVAGKVYCWKEDSAVSHGCLSSSEWTLTVYFLEHLAMFV